MITLADYFGRWHDSQDLTSERRQNAARLLDACAGLEAEMIGDGCLFTVNPKTGTQVSGESYGGFRPQTCPIGAAHSAHKEGLAVDIFDPGDHLDTWIMAHQDALVRHGIYIEHPQESPGWSHWSVRAPASGRHVFFP